MTDDKYYSPLELLRQRDVLKSLNDRRNLKFALESGWGFVETEDWRIDGVAGWSEMDRDEGMFVVDQANCL